MSDSCSAIPEITYYMLSSVIATRLLTLLFVGYLVVVYYYGKYKVNRITFTPYKWAAAGLCLDLVGLMTNITNY